MAIAFKKPFTPGTQEKRDSVNMSDKICETVMCSQCKTEYILVYSSDATVEAVQRYKNSVQAGMGNCNAHRAWVEMNF